jgi:hypothetical protein
VVLFSQLISIVIGQDLCYISIVKYFIISDRIHMMIQ